MDRYNALKEEIKQMRRRFNNIFDTGAGSDEIYRMSLELDDKIAEFTILEKERCKKSVQDA